MALTDGFIEISPCNAYFNTSVITDDLIIRTGTSNQRVVIGTNPVLPSAVTISNNIISLNSNMFIAGGLGVGTTSLASGMVTDIVGNIRVVGDINFSSNLYKNGVLFEGGGGWSNNGGFGIFVLSNVGVQGPSTTNALSVYGRVMMSNFGSNIIGTSNNNIGIGKDEPAYTLDVAGDINFTNGLYQNGVPFQTSRWSNSINGVFINSNVGIGGAAVAGTALTVYGGTTLCNLTVTGPNINLSNVVTAFTNFSNLGTMSLSNLIVRGGTIHLSNVATSFANFSNLGTTSLCNLIVTGPNINFNNVVTSSTNFSNLGTTSLCNVVITGSIIQLSNDVTSFTNFSNLGTMSLSNLVVRGTTIHLSNVATSFANFSNLATTSLCNLIVTGPNITLSNVATSFANFSNLATTSLCNLVVTGPNITFNNVVTSSTNFSNLGTASLCNLVVRGPTIQLSNTVVSFANFSNLGTATLCNATVLGSMNIGGNLTVSGTTTTVDTVNLLINDNILTLNNNQTGTPLTTLLSGIEVERGDASNYFFVFEENTDLFKIGLCNNLQAVATRPDTVTDRTVAIWDNANARYTFDPNIVITSAGNLGVSNNNPGCAIDTRGKIRVTSGNLANPIIGALGGNGDRVILWTGDATNTPYSFGIGQAALWSSVPNTARFVWYVNAIECMTMNSNLLNVFGSITCSNQFIGHVNDTSNLPAYTWSNDTNTGMYHPAADVIGFVTGGVERMFISPGGNVGIGVSSALSRLHVSGTIRGGVTGSGTSLLLGNSDDTNNNRIISALDSTMGNNSEKYIAFGKSNSLRNQAELTFNHIADSSTDNYLSFGFWGAANLLSVIANGNVGVGTVTPSTRLHVVGSITCSNQFIGSENDTSNLPAYSWSNDTNTGMYHPTADVIGFATGGVERVRVDASGFLGVGTTPITTLDVSDARTTNLPLIARFMQPNLSTPNNTGFAFGVATTTANTGFIRFNYNGVGSVSNSISMGTWAATRLLTINHSGNVGIGTLTPSVALQVVGNGLIGDACAISNVGLLVNDDGMVLSDAAAQSNYQLLLFNGNGATNTEGVGLAFTQYVSPVAATDGAAPPGGAIVFKRTNGYSAGDLLFKTRAGIALADPCITRMTITSAGRVGIGTSNPGALLHVNGQIIVNNDNNWNSGGIRFLNPTGVVDAAIVQGNASNAQLVFRAPNNDGITRNGFGFYEHTGITQLVTITNNGLMGIGTSNPSSRLHIGGTTDANTDEIITVTSRRFAGISIQGDSANSGGEPGGSYVALSMDGNITNAFIGLTNAADRDPLGNVFTGAINNGLLINSIVTTAPTTSTMQLATNSIVRMTLDAAGHVGINTINPTYELHVVGQIYATDDILAFSDARLKTELEPITNALDKIKKISGYTYHINNSSNTKRHAGLIAQEVEEVLPEVIYSDSNTGYKSIAYGNTVALLLEAIKELDAKVDSIKSYLNIV